MPVASANSVQNDRPAGRRIVLPVNRWTTDLAQAISDGDTASIDRAARSMACLTPDDPAIPTISFVLPKTDHLDTRASFARMAHCLDPFDRNRANERIHSSIKAARPDLMPPHWMRDALYEAQILQSLLQTSGLSTAREYLRRTDLNGTHCYFPRFRALRHFVMFNTEPEYRASFVENCIATLSITDVMRNAPNVDPNQAVLDDVMAIADWTEKTDTIIPPQSLSISSEFVEKRIRESQIPRDKFTANLFVLNHVLETVFRNFWNIQKSGDFFSELYGISTRKIDDVITTMSIHANEILAGPVLGPHYHSGHDYGNAIFPLLSGVYYPKTVPINADSRAGYLEIGRPDFDIPFEPSCITFQPVAGNLIVFPAFAYHGVIPIDHAPRYSINVDVYLKPRNATSWSISEFFS